MSKPSRKVPELRFKGFTDDWEQRKFFELLDAKNGIRRGPFGSALKKDFFVSKSDYVVYEQQNAIYNRWETRYYITKEKFDELHKFILDEGDFIMSGAGTIGRISRVPAGIKTGVFNQALIRFKINSELTDSDYFLEWIRSDSMQRRLTATNPGSAMTNLVPMSEVKKWEVMLPSLAEQQKIGDAFTKLSSMVALHQRKYGALLRLKEAYLQNLFPKNGESVPKLRFANFDEEWEQRKLGDLVEIVMGQSPLSENYTNNDDNYILVQGNADIKSGWVSPRVWTTQKTKIAEKGDLILTVRAPVGEIARTKYDVVLGRGVAGIKGNDFIYHLFTRLKANNFWIRYSTGSTFASINSIDLKRTSVRFTQENEQILIGSFLNKLDKGIILHQQKLEQLQMLKKAYLQKLFI